MQILKGKVDWHYDCDNTPSLKILVNKLPNLKDLRYQKKGALYFAEQEGYVSFFYYERPGEGYAGRTFSITLTDETKVDLVGPWSSSSRTMNDAGFPHSIEVAITEEPETYERGYTFYSANLTIDFINNYLDKIEIPPFASTQKEFSREWLAPNNFPSGSELVLTKIVSMKKIEPSLSSEQSSVLFGETGIHYVPRIELPNGELWEKKAYVKFYRETALIKAQKGK